MRGGLQVTMCSQLHNEGFHVLHKVHGCQQPCNDARAKGSVYGLFSQKAGTANGHKQNVIVATFRTHIEGDLMAVEVGAERRHISSLRTFIIGLVHCFHTVQVIASAVTSPTMSFSYFLQVHSFLVI